MVRSKLLGWSIAQVTNAFSVIYTCPAGRTAIIKQWSVWNNSDVARTITAAVRTGGVDVRIWLPGLVPVRGGIDRTEQYLVLEPGDSFVVYNGGESTNTSIAVLVAGVELDGVAP